MTKKEFIKLVELLLDNAAEKEAIECKELFPVWHADGTYKAGQKATYGGTLYKCLQDHAAQDGWTPAAAASLWAEILIPDPEVIPDWKQPSSTNPYMAGDKVKHAGKTWVSDIDNNIWEPGVYGWSEVVL